MPNALETPSISQAMLFLEDVMSMVGEKPILFQDLLGALRGSFRSPLSNPSGRRWRRISEAALRGLLQEAGIYFRQRKHGAGLAVYVATVSFSSVVDWNGKTWEVE